MIYILDHFTWFLLLLLRRRHSTIPLFPLLWQPDCNSHLRMSGRHQHFYICASPGPSISNLVIWIRIGKSGNRKSSFSQSWIKVILLTLSEYLKHWQQGGWPWSRSGRIRISKSLVSASGSKHGGLPHEWSSWEHVKKITVHITTGCNILT